MAMATMISISINPYHSSKTPAALLLLPTPPITTTATRRIATPSTVTTSSRTARSRARLLLLAAVGGGGGSTGGGGGTGGFGGGRDDLPSESEEGRGGGMSMSQKITLAYAALVGVGGVMGYMKSGSQKSLAAGGGSALLLYYVYTQLPIRPAFASSLGLGLSAALLAVMGSRFKRSGKIFPAGVVSLVSLVMVAGYAHGILRGLHV